MVEPLDFERIALDFDFTRALLESEVAEDRSEDLLYKISFY